MSIRCRLSNSVDEVGIARMPADTVMKETKTLEENWIPTWDEGFEFPLTVPELALLWIEVHEYDMFEKVSWLYLSSEKVSGTRAVPPYSQGNKVVSVKLLM